MANNAFALSPISASGELPSDTDYQAISDAFMETSRGRWFLTEYARRNRNADTTMVLEAVARIEGTIAAQKQSSSNAALKESGAAVRDIVERAQAVAAAALDRLGQGEVFAPTQRGLRIIREVAWRLREVGYDNRICDILEDQADLIGANHAPALTREIRLAVLDSYQEIARQIGELAAGGAATAARAPADSRPAPEPVAAASGFAHDAAASDPFAPDDASRGDASPGDVSLDDVSPHDVSRDEVSLDDDLLDAALPDFALQDSAVGADDLIVMAEAPSAFGEAGSDEPPAMAGTTATSLPAVNLGVDAAFDTTPVLSQPEAEFPHQVSSQQVSSHPLPSQDQSSQDLDEDLLEVERIVGYPKPHLVATTTETVDAEQDRPSTGSSSLSLGASLLARGMVTKPGSAKPDPLAPIRRMSQAEKVAFFS